MPSASAHRHPIDDTVPSVGMVDDVGTDGSYHSRRDRYRLSAFLVRYFQLQIISRLLLDVFVHDRFVEEPFNVQHTWKPLSYDDIVTQIFKAERYFYLQVEERWIRSRPFIYAMVAFVVDPVQSGFGTEGKSSPEA